MMLETISVSYHQSPHPLFLDSFRLLLLLSLCVGVPCCNGFRQLLDFSRDGPVIFLEIFGMLQNAVEILLHQEENNTSWIKEQYLEFEVGKMF